MNARAFRLLLAAAALSSSGQAPNAENLDAQKNALGLIIDTADRICNVVSNKGEAASTEVKGSVKAELRGLASKLIDAGVSGAGSIANEQYENVLRSDLAYTLKNNAECKLKVLEMLQDKILGQAMQRSPALDGVWHDTNDPNNLTRITQNGSRFDFRRTGTLQYGIRYESSGSGTIDGTRFTSEYRARYQNGATSTGSCSGRLARDGILTSNCQDTFLGEFSGSAIRE